MNKEFIPYEEALALKELGFDEECMMMKYNHENTLISVHIPNELDCPIPLYQQAFRWFREKYPKIEFEFKAIGFYGWSIVHEFEYGGDTKNYEEAELECLKKLIEIAKNK